MSRVGDARQMRGAAMAREEAGPGPADECSRPQPDDRDEDEAEVALGGLVAAGGEVAGVLQLVEAALDPASQSDPNRQNELGTG